MHELFFPKIGLRQKNLGDKGLKLFWGKLKNKFKVFLKNPTPRENPRSAPVSGELNFLSKTALQVCPTWHYWLVFSNVYGMQRLFGKLDRLLYCFWKSQSINLI